MLHLDLGINSVVTKLSSAEMAASIRRVLKEHGRLGVDADALRDDDDLYGAGMTSHSSVNVMLALENEFEIEFPDRMLNRGTFDSVAAIRTALQSLIPAA